MWGMVEVALERVRRLNDVLGWAFPLLSEEGWLRHVAQLSKILRKAHRIRAAERRQNVASGASFYRDWRRYDQRVKQRLKELIKAG